VFSTDSTYSENHASRGSARTKKTHKNIPQTRENLFSKVKKILIDAMNVFWQSVPRSLWFM